MKHRRICAAVLMTLGAAAAQAQHVLIAKQLAGAPEEFKAMQPANPADAAIRSKSALVPIEMMLGGDGQYHWQANLAVDAANVRVMLLKSPQDAWQLRLGSAESKRDSKDADLSRAETLAAVHTETSFGMQAAQVPGELFAFEDLKPGKVTFDLNSALRPSKGFLLLEGDAKTLLVSYQTASNQRVDGSVTITAKMQTNSDSGSIDSEKLRGAAISAAVLNITAPSGRQSQVAFFDDGVHADGSAGDGVFAASFVPAEVGDYVAQARVEGKSGDVDVVRTAEHLIPVISDQVALGSAAVQLSDSKTAGRVSIRVPVSSNNPGQHYRAYAQLWGADANKNPIAIAWVGGMVTPKNGVAELELDTRWIARAGAGAPFSLRQLRLEDPDHFVTVVQADELAITDKIAPVSLMKSVQIDEAMTMGLRPAPLDGEFTNRGVGSQLLLVHGYCSGNVWNVPNFTGASIFQDLSQNRSNDAFALRIAAFGNTWNSYGIVAHSQGGMASLHLYNYYWSGLDNAVGGRLIQSVGTPYKGTNLAGVLAALGGIFGVGCGSNTDLTYTGAANWLAGISTASRAKVNYHTTSFKLTNWWTNDYCNFASDLVLGDPEDGTTEQANGQLSGGVNRGHVTGQCHTDGMRDPAQTRDAGRNATMNANAAR